jgi:hypothetical protein
MTAVSRSSTPATTPYTPPVAQQPQSAPTTAPATAAEPLASTSGSYGYDTGSAYETSGSTTVGGAQLDGYVQGGSFQFNGTGNASVGADGIDVNLSVDVRATAVEAGGSATQTFTVDVGGEQIEVTVDLSAEGVVGADGQINLNIHIGTDGNVSVSAGAEGFAGAQATLTGSVTVTHEGNELASGSVSVSGTAGVAGDAHANIELNDGGLEFDVGAEAAVVGGFGVDVSGNINGGNTAKFLLEVVQGFADQGVDWAKDKVGDVADWAGDRFEDLGDFIGDIIPDVDIPGIPGF